MTASEITIRPLHGTEDLSRARRAFQTALVGIDFPAAADPLPFHEPGRLFGAFDGDRLVGTAEGFTSWLTVPGGARVPHMAVTGVGVLPTHTRRGILSQMMRTLLTDAAGRGEVVASLRASEASIYERFGFGVASRAAQYRIIRARARLRDGVPAGDPVELREPLDSLELMRACTDQVRRSGSIGRYDAVWRWRRLRWERREGLLYMVVAGDPDAPSGYALYHPADGPWFGSEPRTIVVPDLVALTDAAWIGLIRHLVGLDLVEQVQLPGPTDSPLRILMQDDRAVELLSDEDETWLALLDVEAALAARRYDAGGGEVEAVVLGVEDRLSEANRGRYRISAAGSARTDDAPDLTLDVATLAAAYLGGTRFADLALAGRITEHQAGAVRRADRLFAADPAPYAGTSF